MLDRFCRHLKPGGALLLYVYSLTAFTAKEETFTCARNLLDGNFPLGFSNTNLLGLDGLTNSMFLSLS